MRTDEVRDESIVGEQTRAGWMAHSSSLYERHVSMIACEDCAGSRADIYSEGAPWFKPHTGLSFSNLLEPVG